MKTITVRAGSGEYDVLIGGGLIERAGELAAPCLAGAEKVALVADDRVMDLYGATARAAFEGAGFEVREITFPRGEASKNLRTFADITDGLAAAGLSRRDAVAALGGGVTGDMAGFAAACWMRGVRYVQLPTSLLAMVDSSVGGKTAVDIAAGKNLCGAFHQPAAVLCDTGALATLPPEYVKDGLGEIIKYGVGFDADIMGMLEGRASGFTASGDWDELIARCVAIKARVVEADEREGGERRKLNLGHTAAHAIEKLSGYGISHGRAVAIGTRLIAAACVRRGALERAALDAIDAALASCGLSGACPYTAGALAEAAAGDKKRAGGTIALVLPASIGECRVKEIAVGDLEGFFADGLRRDRAPGTAVYSMGGRRVTIHPKGLHGTIAAVTSKSDAHRVLICAALADKPTRIHIETTNRDIDATASCLVSMGAKIDRQGTEWTITPIDTANKNASGGSPARGCGGRGGADACRTRRGDSPEKKEDAPRDLTIPVLNCGESGSTLRFLLPVLPALGIEREVTGGGRLPERPLSPLREELEARGAAFGAASLPFRVSGRLAPGEFRLPGDVSSQYISGLLFALPLLDGDSRIVLTSPLESRGYIDMTTRTLARFGVEIHEEGGAWRVPGRQTYSSPGELMCDGDWSGAAFFLAAGAITETGLSVGVTGLDLLSAQGDRAVLDLLRRFGASVKAGGSEITVTPGSHTGAVIDARDVPDLVPVLSAVAASASGETRITNAARLRLKESDRLRTTADMIRALGGDCEELPDGLLIRGRHLSGGEVDCAGDHRIAMSAAIAATACGGPVTLAGAEAVEKSYPGFFCDFRHLGGAAEEES